VFWWRKRARLLNQFAEQLRFASRETTRIGGLSQIRMSAAQTLAADTTTITELGRFTKGSDNLGLIRWQVSPNAPVMLEKVTLNQREYQFVRQAAGQPIRHIPNLLGATSVRFKYHIFMTECSGGSLTMDHPMFQIERLIDIAHEFRIDVEAALPSASSIYRKELNNLKSPWMRSILANKGTNFDRIDTVISQIQNGPYNIHHGDLHLGNVMIDEQSNTTKLKLIDFGSISWAPLGSDLLFFAQSGVTNPHAQIVFERGARRLSTLTRISLPLIRANGFLQGAERFLNRCVNRKTDRWIEPAHTLLTAAHNALAETP
jgi:serine/threonine protein kinase